MAHAHVVVPEDKADVAKLAAIGPKRKLFDTSLCDNSTAVKRTMNTSMRSESLSGGAQ
jgi:hypothetical protein